MVMLPPTPPTMPSVARKEAPITDLGREREVRSLRAQVEALNAEVARLAGIKQPLARDAETP